MNKQDGNGQNPHAKVRDTLSGPETNKDLTEQEHRWSHEGVARGGRTADDIKELHSTFGLNRDVLKQIPIVDAGERLQQGATYLDLRQPESEPFTATAEQKAGEDQLLVRKADVAYEIWNRLTDEEKPDEEFEDSPDYRTG